MDDSHKHTMQDEDTTDRQDEPTLTERLICGFPQVGAIVLTVLSSSVVVDSGLPGRTRHNE